jgi:adenine/guanine phosphoribosyltransferase-like PRPP-binding protein
VNSFRFPAIRVIDGHRPETLAMEPHQFWQAIEPGAGIAVEPMLRDSFPARLPDGGVLHLPIRALDDGVHGLASLIINQASFAVQEHLAATLAERLQPYEPEVVVGLPTLGLTLAGLVAKALGHLRYVPLGTSRKFWYDERLSVGMSSITTASERRLYLDPRLLPLVAGKRLALIDDVVSSGTSMAAGLGLLEACGVQPVVLGVAMRQTERWRQRLGEIDSLWPDRLRGVFDTPRLLRVEGGWQAE